MRQVWYSVAMSLDGFIGGPNGEFDWIPNEPEIDWGAFMGRFDTVLMGRRSYEASLALPGGGAMPGVRVFVFSRTLKPEAHPNVTIVRDNIAETMATLRQESGRDIWLYGGGELFRCLLEMGVVDRIEVGLVPALVGKGIPFLPGLDKLARLNLTGLHRYPTGITLLTYDVVR